MANSRQNIRKLVKDGFVIRKPTKVSERQRRAAAFPFPPVYFPCIRGQKTCAFALTAFEESSRVLTACSPPIYLSLDSSRFTPAPAPCVAWLRSASAVTLDTVRVSLPPAAKALTPFEWSHYARATKMQQDPGAPFPEVVLVSLQRTAP
jgi:hypothetical protein